MTEDRALRFSGRYYRLYPPEAPLGEIEEELTLPIDNTVFLLVDVYGKRYDDDFEAPADLPSIYRAPSNDPVREIVRNKIVPAKAAARRAGLRVVYVSNYLSPGLSEGNEWRTMSVRTCGVDVLEAWVPPTPILEHASIIAPQPGEPLVLKQHYSPCASSSATLATRPRWTRLSARATLWRRGLRPRHWRDREDRFGFRSVGSV
jgi:hypothetical protein